MRHCCMIHIAIANICKVLSSSLLLRLLFIFFYERNTTEQFAEVDRE